MKKSNEIAKLSEALAKAQIKLSPVTKNRTVTVRPRSGGTPYSFEYATFDAVIEHVRKALTENGLWFVQTLEPSLNPDGTFYQGSVMVLETVLLHSSGEWISSQMFVPDEGSNQDLGSALTYRKRYALSSLLGIGSESDDDANAADDNTVVSERAMVAGATTHKTAEPPPTNKSAEAAKQFLEQANVFLQAVQNLDDFQAWHKENLAKVAKLRSYFPQEHKDLIALIDSTEISLGG